MSVIGANNPTLLDMAKITEPGGAIADVVEALTQSNPILMDAPAFESNLPTGHLVTIESGLPAVGWRNFNQGVDSSKLTTIQVTESIGMLNGLSRIDRSLARLNGNEAAYRARQDRAFLRSMNNEVARTLFYGTTSTDPEQFHGLTPRFNLRPTAEGGSSTFPAHAQVINSGITASGAEQSSIWLIVWGEDTVHLTYPKGSNVGITPTDMGLQMVDEAATGTPTGKQFVGYVTSWEWQIGLVVKDWRYVARIVNIDSSAFSATGVEIINALVKAYNYVRDLTSGRPVFYVNRTAATFLDLQIMNKGNMLFNWVDWHGHKVNSFRGIPILICDGLLATEAVVS